MKLLNNVTGALHKKLNVKMVTMLVLLRRHYWTAIYSELRRPMIQQLEPRGHPV